MSYEVKRGSRVDGAQAMTLVAANTSVPLGFVRQLLVRAVRRANPFLKRAATGGVL